MRRALIGVFIGGALFGSGATLAAVTHYGSPATLNAGYVIGADDSAAELGIETRGVIGIFGHMTTPWGTLDMVTDPQDPLFTWCPSGASDIECGA